MDKLSKYIELNKKENLMDVILAKSVVEGDAQTLTEHSFAVGVLCKALSEKLLPQHDSTLSCFSGYLHDIGKISKDYQEAFIVGSFDKEFEFRHTVIGYSLIESLMKKNSSIRVVSGYLAFWHHAKNIFDEDFIIEDVLTYMKTKEENVFLKVRSFLNDIEMLNNDYFDNRNGSVLSHFESNEYFENSSQIISQSPMSSEPKFSSYKSTKLFSGELSSDSVYQNKLFSELRNDFENNALNSIRRTILIISDRLVSSLEPKRLRKLINEKKIESELFGLLFNENNRNELTSSVQNYLSTFIKENGLSERTIAQERISKDMSNENFVILEGAAGVGKTRIALEWAKNKESKKLIWICPRKQVCDSVFDELRMEYVSDLKIEILTGDRKEFSFNKEVFSNDDSDIFSGDIVVTTIDQISSIMYSNSFSLNIKNLFSSTIVVDEFHELQSTKGLLLILGELVSFSKMLNNPIMLMSATVNYTLVSKLFDIRYEDIGMVVFSIKSFNESLYSVKIVEELTDDSLMFEEKVDKSIFIFNTATSAFKSYLSNCNEDSILFHSRMSFEDKQIVIDNIFSNFGKNKDSSKVLRSGPIVQASLNISAPKVFTQVCSPENTLQRIGRNNRFGECDKPEFTIVYNKSDRGSASVLRSQRDDNRTREWFSYLISNIGDEKITINDVTHQAGVSRNTFYYHFSDINELLEWTFDN